MRTGMIQPDRLERLRSLFPFTAAGTVYLNHAGTSPLSTRVVETMTQYLHERSDGTIENYVNDMKMVTRLRSMVQRLIGAPSPDRISFHANTSDAINIVAAGLQWKPGDRVLLNSIEFPANVYPYLNVRRHGVEIDFLDSASGRVPLETIEQGITARTRLLALSAVQFLSGYRADLEAIGRMCRSRGVIFAVDGIQAVGAVRMDVQRMNIDALAAGCQKWQMGPQGAGFLYLTEELQHRIHQATLGWLSVDNPWEFYNYAQPLAASARRYEGGTLTVPSLWGMEAALGTLLDVGMDAVEDQILALTEILIEEFSADGSIDLYTPPDRHHRAGIVTLNLPPHVDQRTTFRTLAGRKLITAIREGKLRLSPHFYNSPDDMRRTAAIIREYCARP
jgi:selenocysteine lyase/cysteine desulfurase